MSANDTWDDDEPTDEYLSPSALASAAAKEGFLPLMQVIERITSSSTPIGGKGPPSEEPVLLRHDPSMGFSTSDVCKVEIHDHKLDGTPGLRFEVITAFLGLTGSVSPLPMTMVENIGEDSPEERARRDFLDLFHHRILSLFYRAYMKHSLPTSSQVDGQDHWSRRMMHLAGFDTEADSKLQSLLPTANLLRLVPLLAGGARLSVRTLELALADTLQKELGEDGSIVVEQFIPHWLPIAISDRTRLGAHNSRLGQPPPGVADGDGAFVLGARARDRSSKLRIHVGPVSFATYLGLLPKGSQRRRIKDTIAVVGQDGFEYELEVTIRPGDAPPFRLSNNEPRRLGQSTWLSGRSDQESQVRLKLTS